MAKRRTDQTIDKAPTELVKTREEFNQFLERRILIGEELYQCKIQTEKEFKENKEDFYNWCDYNSEYLKHAFNKENNEYKTGFDRAGAISISIIGGRQTLGQELKEFKEKIDYKLKNLKKLRAKTELLKIDSDIETQNTTEKRTPELNKSKVFIVHGHDDVAKTKTARFVEKLGFEAIILHEKASGSKTIIEKIEEYSNVGFGIILYTPCDIGAKNTDSPDLKNRARQNVVFEHGFLIGKIGRSNVCALVKGDIETPNDISGVVYVSMDSADAWRYSIADEMKRAGYNVDKNEI